jgi:SAM-dependent methyltransferase
MTSVRRPLDGEKLDQLAQHVLADFGATASAPLVLIGDRLGLFRALADGAPLTSAELAERTGTHERYVREWLAAMAASGYVTLAAGDDEGDGAGDGADRFHLEPEQAAVFTDESSPVFLVGGFEVVLAAGRGVDRVTDAFRTGRGIGWADHDPALFPGAARFFRTGYAANTADWLRALDDVPAKLMAGGRVADVGCGYGYSTMLMANAYPRSTFTGYDSHGPSIAAARRLAAEAGVADHVSFEVAGAHDFPGTGLDLVSYFICLHDMGDPVGALRHARDALAEDGTVLLVEPAAGDSVAANLGPVGRIQYSTSTLVCTPSSLAEDVGAALGAQAGPARLAAVAAEAGLSRFRVAARTPFNLVCEARR